MTRKRDKKMDFTMGKSGQEGWSIWIEAPHPLLVLLPSPPSRVSDRGTRRDELLIYPGSLKAKLHCILYVYIMDDWPWVPPAILLRCV